MFLAITTLASVALVFGIGLAAILHEMLFGQPPK